MDAQTQQTTDFSVAATAALGLFSSYSSADVVTTVVQSAITVVAVVVTAITDAAVGFGLSFS